MLRRHDLEIRVRYHDTDGQKRAHHSAFVNYFETGRVELLRAAGHSYKQVEEAGIFLVVKSLEVRYHLPADYDDLLILTTETVRAKGARIEHRYVLMRDEDLIAEATTIVACIDPTGKVRRLPDWLILAEGDHEDPKSRRSDEG